MKTFEYKTFVNLSFEEKKGIITNYGKSEQFKQDFPLAHNWPSNILERMLYNPFCEDIEMLVAFCKSEYEKRSNV